MALRLISLACILLAVRSAALAQNGATISGSAYDPSGAFVSGAAVTLTSQETSATRTAVTDAEGSYTLASLSPGHYRLEFTASGFRKFVAQNILLEVDQRLRVDARFAVGEVAETMEVTDQPSTVNTVDAVVKTVIDQRRVVDLPLNGRSALQLMALVPGVHVIEGSAAKGLGTSFIPSGQQFIGASGSRGDETNFVLDGGDNNDDYRTVANAFPNPDFLQEFSLQTNSFSAEYGRLSGGVANAVTKSGTNRLHGTLFEFVRNNALNARNFFATSDDGLKRNQWGATVGGPVRLPGYDGRDRTFFFAGYQGTAIRQRPNTITATVPTAQQRTGDFRNFLDSQRRLIVIKDPSTGSPFANNTIPQSLIDPVVPKLLNYIPAAQSADGTLRYAVQSVDDAYEYVMRIDHNFSDRDRVFGRFFRSVDSVPNTGIAGNILSYATAQRNRSLNARVQYDRGISPTTMATLGFTYNRSYGLREGTTPITWQALGVKAPPAGATDDFLISVPGFFAANLFGDTPIARNTFQYQASMGTLKGRHYLRYGFDASRHQFNVPIVNVGFHGSFAFNLGLTGNNLSDLILGRPSGFTQSSGFQVRLRETDWTGWFSDEIKLSRRITLTAGLRFEPFLPWVDRWRANLPQVARFVPGQQSVVFPNAPRGLNYYGDPGVPEAIVDPSTAKFSPRVGIAIDPFGNGRTSIRAGYGLFRLQLPAVVTQDISNSNPVFNATVNVNLPASLSDPFQGQPAPPWPAKIVPFDAQFPFLFNSKLPQNHFDQPYTQQWNLTLERQLPDQWLGSVSYQGSKGTHLFSNWEANYAPYVAGQSTTANIQQRRLYPQLGAVQVFGSNGFSQYHALVLSGSRRFARSYSVLASYTWSKLIDSGSASQGLAAGGMYANPYQWFLDKGLGDYHHTHTSFVSFIWELPRLQGAHAAVRSVVGNWQANGIVRLQSGEYQSVTSSFGNSLSGVGADRADLIGNPSLPGGRSEADQLAQWFNSKAFARNAAGTFGTAGRNILLGPALVNADLALFKNIPLAKERAKLQFRAEFFNALNHANFNQPVANVDSATFGRILTARSPRILQFALKLTY